MSSDEEKIAGFLASLFAVVDAVRECDSFEECLIHAGLAIPEEWRPAHQAFAERYGLWWRACPLCGEHFGSHEHGDTGGQYVAIEDSEEGDPLPEGWRRPVLLRPICRACSRPGRIERLAALAARGKITDDEAVRWAAQFYPESDGSESITREAIEDARAAMAAPPG